MKFGKVEIEIEACWNLDIFLWKPNVRQDDRLTPVSNSVKRFRRNSSPFEI